MALGSSAYAQGRHVPAIEGHVTDPTHKLNGSEKDDLEKLLGSLQTETKVDVAVFVAEVPSADLDDVARAAYDQWGIGRAWENGMLLVVASDGSGAFVAQDPKRPPVLAGNDLRTLTQQVGSTIPARGFAQGLRDALDFVGTILRPKSKIPVVRPSGVGNHEIGRRYTGWTGLVVLVALVMAAVRARKQYLAGKVAT